MTRHDLQLLNIINLDVLTPLDVTVGAGAAVTHGVPRSSMNDDNGRCSTQKRRSILGGRAHRCSPIRVTVHIGA